MSSIQSDRERYHKTFILLLVAGIVVLFIFMIRDFLIAILLAGVFSGLLYPIYQRMLDISFLQNRPGITSFLVLILAFIVIGLPVAGLFSIVSSEAIQISEKIVPWLQQNLFSQMNLSKRLPSWLPFAHELNPYKESIINTFDEATSAAGTLLVKSGSALTQGTLSFVINLFVMLYAMFFFLLKGPEWIRELDSYLPLTAEEEQQVITRGLSVTRASLKGILGIGLLQGFLVGFAFWVIGLEGAAFWGTVVAVLSAVPGIGPPLVWIPAAVYLFMTDQTGWGIALTIWGSIVVGLADNVLRPSLVSAETRIPDLLILLSILGGIVMFGAIGILIGPIIAAGLVTILDIYRRAFVRQLPPAQK